MDYANHVIQDVLISGLSDPDIRKDMLGTKDILTKPINDIIVFVETKEMAQNATPSATLSSISTFKQIAKEQLMTPSPVPAPSDRDRVTSCPDYKASFKMLTEGTQGWNTKPPRCVTTAEHVIGINVSAAGP